MRLCPGESVERNVINASKKEEKILGTFCGRGIKAGKDCQTIKVKWIPWDGGERERERDRGRKKEKQADGPGRGEKAASFRKEKRWAQQCESYLKTWMFSPPRESAWELSLDPSGSGVVPVHLTLTVSNYLDIFYWGDVFLTLAKTWNTPELNCFIQGVTWKDFSLKYTKIAKRIRRNDIKDDVSRRRDILMLTT